MQLAAVRLERVERPAAPCIAQSLTVSQTIHFSFCCLTSYRIEIRDCPRRLQESLRLSKVLATWNCMYICGNASARKTREQVAQFGSPCKRQTKAVPTKNSVLIEPVEFERRQL